MKKLLFIFALAFSINSFAQTDDSVVYCQATTYIDHSSSSLQYHYNINYVNPDGTVSFANNGYCSAPIELLGKLGKQGWHLVLVSTNAIVNLLSADDQTVFIFEKTYKRR